MSSSLESTSKKVGGLNVAFTVIWKTLSVKRCLYPFLNGISSFAIPTLSHGFKFGFLPSLVDRCASCETVCYMLRQDHAGCQSCYAIDSRIDCVKERLQLIYVAIRPFVLQMFVDDVFERSNNALCECSFHFTVCGVSVNAFAFAELFESSFELGSFIRSYFQWFSFGDHAIKKFSGFLLTLSSQWLNSEFS